MRPRRVVLGATALFVLLAAGCSGDALLGRTTQATLVRLVDSEGATHCYATAQTSVRVVEADCENGTLKVDRGSQPFFSFLDSAVGLLVGLATRLPF